MSPALIRIKADGERLHALGGTRTDLVSFMTGPPVAVTLVQTGQAESVAALQAGPREHPVVRLQHLVRGDGHRSRIGEDDAEQIGFGLHLGVESAFTPGRPGVEAAHRPAVVEELDLAVDAVASEVKEPAGALEH